ncbi:hypothetical protein KK062_24920 [Fulvivirgaceae bacterium PWU5]|uniref:Lipoprotein n=1 Tax=Dawidia cretensis TaxID=2782350 RepID=A0AAP2GSR8_9BACT|nr:hypothetical protein [Dawidia cretensis]MBT1711509.1 hypothetical protein [Dawidia cretensis]
MTRTCRTFKGASHTLFTCLLLSVASCSGDDGPVGQQRTEQLKDSPTPGYFEGIIEGTRVDGTPFSETFQYAYRPNVWVGGDSLKLHRRLRDEAHAPYLQLDVAIQHRGTAQEALVPLYLAFEFSKALSATTQFYLYAEYYGRNYSSDLKITRYDHDQATGAMRFDFAYDGNGQNDNSTNRSLRIRGSFISGTEPVFAQVVNRWNR